MSLYFQRSRKTKNNLSVYNIHTLHLINTFIINRCKNKPREFISINRNKHVFGLGLVVHGLCVLLTWTLLAWCARARTRACSPLGRTSAPTRGLGCSLTLAGKKEENKWAYAKNGELKAGGVTSKFLQCGINSLILSLYMGSFAAVTALGYWEGQGVASLSPDIINYQ